MALNRLDNLQDWRRGLEELEELQRLQLLDRYQDRLREILKSEGNWRLKEGVLESMGGIKEPGDELMQEVCSIMCNGNQPPALRMRAVYAIRDFVLKRRGAPAPLPRFEGVTFVDKIKELVGVPMEPILQKRVVRALEQITADGGGA